MQRKYNLLISVVILSGAFVVFYIATSAKVSVYDEAVPVSTVKNKVLQEQPDLFSIQRQLSPSISYDSYQSKYGELPKSLKGTIVPVYFLIDDAGHLIVTLSIKTLIEYFLSTIGEESYDVVIERMYELISGQLQEPARSEAIAVIDQYIAYKQSLVELERHLAADVKLSGKASDYQLMFNVRRDARIKYLSQEVYDAFFSDEDKEDQYTAQMLELRANKSLSVEEQAIRQKELEALLPEKEQKQKQKERDRLLLKTRISEARNAGASEEYVFQLRSEVYGYEAAERFAAADKAAAVWDQRFQEYRQQRQAILDSRGLSNDDIKQQMEVLKSRLFNKQEKIRISTLDRMADK